MLYVYNHSENVRKFYGIVTAYISVCPRKRVFKSYRSEGLIYLSQLYQEVSLKNIIVEGYRTVGSLNDSFQSSNNLLLLLFSIDFGQW